LFSQVRFAVTGVGRRVLDYDEIHGEGQFMKTIRIRKKLESETLHLPELRSLIGKNVDITVSEAPTVPQTTPGRDDWDAAMQAACELEDYDYDAFQRQRDYDVQHGRDHLP
jgi:hypothetical protein